MSDISCISTQFRKAIESALLEGEFDNDITFNTFPRGCCGDASTLLSQYLLECKIRTFYVCGYYYYTDETKNRQFHAWLWTQDKTIIDITGDQFRDDVTFLNYNIPVYVGAGDEFHRLFNVDERNVHENLGLDGFRGASMSRLYNLYDKITKRIG